MSQELEKNEYQIRREKLDDLKQFQVDLYPARAKKTCSIDQLKINFKIWFKKNKSINLVGRIKTKREHGNLTFVNLEDLGGQFQLAFSKKDIGTEKYKNFVKLIDIADFIQVTGTLFSTHQGEPTLMVKKWQLLSKALRPLPEKWHGLKDQELRYRQRYVDLIINHDVRELFIKKSQFIQNIRQFLIDQKFLEVETPTLEAVPGGAEAEPFITHHNTLDIDLYLRISLELHLKRLMVGGYEKVFEIGKVFRNEGMSQQHLQEFTLMEFYWAYADWQDLMQLTQKMYAQVIKQTFSKLKFNYQGTQIDFKAPWQKINYIEIFKKKTGVDLEKPDATEKLFNFLKTKDKKVFDEFKKLQGQDINQLGRVIDTVYNIIFVLK
jgi:lysyl-tRNA synthetase class 2